MLTLYWIRRLLTGQLLRRHETSIGQALFTHKSGDFGAISVTERSCTATILQVDCHISDRFLPLFVTVFSGVWTVRVGERTGTHLDGSKYSEVRTGIQCTRPSRSTVPARVQKVSKVCEPVLAQFLGLIIPRGQSGSGHVVQGPRIRHRSELTERDWKNVVQERGKTCSTSVPLPFSHSVVEIFSCWHNLEAILYSLDKALAAARLKEWNGLLLRNFASLRV